MILWNGFQVEKNSDNTNIEFNCITTGNTNNNNYYYSSTSAYPTYQELVNTLKQEHDKIISKPMQKECTKALKAQQILESKKLEVQTQERNERLKRRQTQRQKWEEEEKRNNNSNSNNNNSSNNSNNSSLL